MKSFEFKKKLMQEHFNENYVESDTYPNSTFKGKITNMDDVDLDTNGKYKVNVEGELTIHGVTKEQVKFMFPARIFLRNLNSMLPPQIMRLLYLNWLGGRLLRSF